MCEKKTNKIISKCSDVDKAFCDMEKDYHNLIEIIDSFHGVNKKPINKSDLDNFPLGQWIDIGGGIKIKKRKNRFQKYLSFDTEMKKGAEFGEHFHNDIIESCEVMEGWLYDRITKEDFKKGDVAHYEKGEKHEPIAKEKTFLHVLFKP